MFKAFQSECEEKMKEKILELKELLQLELPSDYTEFLIQTNGGMFEDFDHSFVVSGSEEIEMDVLFGFHEQDSLDLLSWNNEYRRELVNQTVIIGVTLGAGLIIMSCQKEYEGVYLWDDAVELPASTEEECVYRIADNFTSFLEMVNGPKK